jgi:hypothetical protein
MALNVIRTGVERGPLAEIGLSSLLVTQNGRNRVSSSDQRQDRPISSLGQLGNAIDAATKPAATKAMMLTFSARRSS